MSNRGSYAARRGCLIAAILLGFLGPALAQESAPEQIPAVEIGRGVAVDAPSPVTSTDEQPEHTSPTTQQSAQPTAAIESEGEAPPTCDKRCQEAEQREKDDLEAQRGMARSADDLVFLTIWQIVVGAAGITLLIITLNYTRKATNAAIIACPDRPNLERRRSLKLVDFQFGAVHTDPNTSMITDRFML